MRYVMLQKKDSNAIHIGRVTDGINTSKAFKPKTCAGCGQIIEKGYFYTKTVGLVDGTFRSCSWHPGCSENHIGHVKDRQSEE